MLYGGINHPHSSNKYPVYKTYSLGLPLLQLRHSASGYSFTLCGYTLQAFIATIFPALEDEGEPHFWLSRVQTRGGNDRC